MQKAVGVVLACSACGFAFGALMAHGAPALGSPAEPERDIVELPLVWEPVSRFKGDERIMQTADLPSGQILSTRSPPGDFRYSIGLDVDDQGCRFAVQRPIDFESFWCRSPWRAYNVLPATPTSKMHEIVYSVRGNYRDADPPEGESDVAYIAASRQDLTLLWKDEEHGEECTGRRRAELSRGNVYVLAMGELCPTAPNRLCESFTLADGTTGRFLGFHGRSGVDFSLDFELPQGVYQMTRKNGVIAVTFMVGQ